MSLAWSSRNGYSRLRCRQQKKNKVRWSKEAQAAHHAMPLKVEGLDKKLLTHRKHLHTYIRLDERISSTSSSDPQTCVSAKRMNVLTHACTWGGINATPFWFFWNDRWSAGWITLKFCRDNGSFLAQLLEKKLTLTEQWHHNSNNLGPICHQSPVFRYLTCYWLEWRYDVWFNQYMTILDIWHCVLTFQRSL